MLSKAELQEELQRVNKQLDVVEVQIQNTEYNITGLIAQQTKYLDRRDMLEAEKARLEAELTALEKEKAGD
ncbi:MAG: hypothetical protein GX257_10110 [Clostridiales bacterium]|nr:hypothetical protein [Clostridiales bacterium]